MIAGLVGLLMESWGWFTLAAVACVAASVHSSDFRLRPRQPRPFLLAFSCQGRRYPSISDPGLSSRRTVVSSRRSPANWLDRLAVLTCPRHTYS